MPDLTLSEFADKMSELLPGIMHEFARRQTNELYRGTITLPQFILLEYLSQRGQAKMTELASFVKVTTAAMTGIVDRLVHSGHLKRLSDPKDRRIVMVQATAKGEGILKKINHERHRMILDIFGKLSQEERAEYLRILLHIRQVLTAGKERDSDA